MYNVLNYVLYEFKTALHLKSGMGSTTFKSREYLVKVRKQLPWFKETTVDCQYEHEKLPAVLRVQFQYFIVALS